MRAERAEPRDKTQRAGGGLGLLHHRVSLLSVGVSLLMTFVGGPRVMWPLGGLTALIWGLSLRRGWRAPPLWLPHPALILGAVALWYHLAADLILFLIGVVVSLSLLRLLALRGARSYTQLYLLSFAQVTLAAQLEGGLSYGLLLTIYMIFITVSLTLNHLRRQLEVEPEPRRLLKQLSSKRLLPGRFIWGVGLIAALLCFSSITLFFMLPRVGGQWFQGYQRSSGVAGFSAEVALGEVGSIQKDGRVAFRVKLFKPSANSPLLVGSPLIDLKLDELERAEGAFPAGERYWVGRRLDRYERGRWSHRAPNIAQRFAPQLSPLHGDTHWLSAPLLYETETRERLIWQELFMEQRGHEALFSLSEPLALVIPRATPVRPLKVTEDQSLLYRWEGGFRYQVLSLRPRARALAEAPLARYRAQAEALPHYGSLTQLPEALEAALLRRAAPLVSSARSASEAARLLSDHLSSNYRYRLEGLSEAPEGRDPVLHFLEESRAGHCEYFSSALTLMLRSLGLPARMVTGYQGGSWNEYGGYLTVYQRDAHAWVELWVGGDPLLPSSWARFDPTPARSQPDLSQAAWRRWLDQVEFAWLRYVIGFEAQDQVKALHRAEGEVSSLILSLRRWWYQSSLRALLLSASTWGAWLTQRSIPLLSLMIALIALIALRSRRAQRGLVKGQTKRVEQSLSALYLRALKAYERAGFPSRANLSGAELLGELSRERAPSLELMRALTERYESLRFGAISPEERGPELSELSSLVQELEASLREYSRSYEPPAS